MKRRADELVLERGLATSLVEARALILAREIVADDHVVEKAGTSLSIDVVLRRKNAPTRFVSRGGDKLDAALQRFSVEVSGKICADFGASTGGFTDALLQRGAVRVHAIDVGYGQLHERLRGDPRLRVHDRTNARDVSPAMLGERVDLVVIDASFISLTALLPAAVAVLRRPGTLVALVKPQFEAPRDAVGEGGVVSDEAVRQAAISRVIESLTQLGFTQTQTMDSTVPGPAGNVEALIAARLTE